MSYNAVIAAVSTPPGKGGVAVIRMSGDGALKIADKVFISAGGKRLSELAPRVQGYGYLMDGGELIDDVMAVRFIAPFSYTGEETVEISAHGGTLITRSVLELLFRYGAVPAAPGEFTRRAFINGKLTLTDAEAIGNLLDARTDTQLALFRSDSRKRLNESVENIRSLLVDTLSSMLARIDYPEEDLGDFTDAELLERLTAAKNMLKNLIATYRTGKAISEGISTVLCGKPNVGKSSVYNAILGEDAAIVTAVAGTTRDVLEHTASLGRVMLRLYDTAGIHESEEMDEVEKIGVSRSLKRIEEAELIIAVFDLSRELDGEDRAIIKRLSDIKTAKIALLNKSDLEKESSPVFDKTGLDGIFDAVLTVSASDGEELKACLCGAVEKLFTDEKINPSSDAIVASARQHGALTRAYDFLELAHGALSGGFLQDAVASDIERALGAISECDGISVSEEVVSDIFSKFCVGK
ncbi:MAG: tRNA uridine-5-carboxymethylaminomethyl(34) synthesis GTPase MnmE [Clostridia bacterium]|nr:tRNA uridine-5-carboxymethylaminomethyl(34) synthesis GTPase MnmE [Clostridia bacterium]